jgi:hypothetical protein
MDKFLISKNTTSHKKNEVIMRQSVAAEVSGQITSINSSITTTSNTSATFASSSVARDKVMLDVDTCMSMIKSKKQQIIQLQKEIDELENLLSSGSSTSDNNAAYNSASKQKSTHKQQQSSKKTSSMEDKIIDHYKFEDLHLHEGQMHVTKKSKKRKGKTQDLMLNPQRFVEYGWGIYKEPSDEAEYGQVFCGICLKAKETGSLLF